jgi:hypothetical protein
MKPLEKAMHKKRAEQTKNVKKLTTSDDAYSPEKRQIKIFKNRGDGSGTGMVKMTTDWSNLKDETSKAKKHFTKKVGRPTSVQVLGPKDFDQKKRRRYYKGGDVNTRRENRLEELGRVDAEKAYTKKGKHNLKAEKKRIVREVSSRGAAKRGHGAEIK